MLHALAALMPPVCVAAIFWYVMRSVLHADRNERSALAALDAREALRVPAPVVDEGVVAGDVVRRVDEVPGERRLGRSASGATALAAHPPAATAADGSAPGPGAVAPSA